MKELNYQPNEMARALFRRKSNMIGLIIPTVAHPFFSELTYHLEYYADQNGYKLLLCNSNRDIIKERKYIEMLKKNQVDAIIMGSSVLDVEHYLDLNLPLVSFDRILGDNVPLVTSDNFMGGKLAGQLLIKKGCRKTAILYRGIGGPHHQAMLASSRVQGFKEEMMAAGLEPFYVQLDASDEDDLKTREDIAQFLKEYPNVDGIFASSDVIAAEVLQVCHQLNKQIPDDIKIIGYDDVKIASLLSPSLSTVRQPIEDMSRCTIEMIVKQVEGEEIPKLSSFPVTLVERGTT
ncbi:LacI family DNA-binding transcriptional regulator [Marinicrinis lubricantis]